MFLIPYTNFHEINLDWIINNLKIVENKIEELYYLIDEMKDVEDRMKKLEDDAKALRSEFMNFTNDVNSRFDQLNKDFQAQFEAQAKALDKKFDDLQATITAQLEEFKSEVYLRVQTVERETSEMNDRLDRVLSDLPNEIKMVSPYTGQEDTIQNIIDQLAGGGRIDALTAAEYDALELEAETYDNKQITAYDYDWTGKTLLQGE